jgi:release factor glutamine methyltransferase
MQIGEWIQNATARLKAGGVSCGDYGHHARQIAEHCLHLTAAQILSDQNCELSAQSQAQLESFLSRRLQGEPLQYIAGHEYFWKSQFRVGPGVLIPRRETEHVIEYLCSVPDSVASVVELGAGSGNIGISLLLERPGWSWKAVEKSPLAYSYAADNAHRILGSPGKHGYHLVQGDFFALMPQVPMFDFLVSNPPYIASAEIDTLSKEVQNEPREALDGGPTGLAFLERLARAGLQCLKPGGRVVLEIGSDQEAAGLEIFRTLGYVQTSVLKDLAGLPRVLVGRKA